VLHRMGYETAIYAIGAEGRHSGRPAASRRGAADGADLWSWRRHRGLDATMARWTFAWRLEQHGDNDIRPRHATTRAHIRSTFAALERCSPSAAARSGFNSTVMTRPAEEIGYDAG